MHLGDHCGWLVLAARCGPLPHFCLPKFRCFRQQSHCCPRAAEERRLSSGTSEDLGRGQASMAIASCLGRTWVCSSVCLPGTSVSKEFLEALGIVGSPSAGIGRQHPACSRGRAQRRLAPQALLKEIAKCICVPGHSLYEQ